MIIDDAFVDRYLDSLPQQQLGVGEEGDIAPITQHWIGEMIDDVFDSPDPSCERFSKFVKANLHLFEEYACKAGKSVGMTPKMQVAFMLELVAIFSYKVMKRAHEEVIERMKEDGLEDQ